MNIRSFLVVLPLILSLTACLGMGIQEPAPITNYGQDSGAGSAGVHNVLAGDTLYSISNRYRLPMRDIAVVNRLNAPFVLREGQRLKLPPPQEYTVQQGDTLYGISRLFGVNSSEIARMNQIEAPYKIHVGDVLRLPSVTRRTQMAQSSPVSASSVQRQALSAPQGQNSTRMASVEGNDVPVPSGKPGSGSSSITTQTPRRSSDKFLRPVDGKIVSDYGAKKNGLHNDGINISAPRGTPVSAAENGVVVYAGNELKGSGNLVLIRHEDQFMTAYAHMDHISIKKGQVIKRGQKIGTVGSSGSVSNPQLHFEVRRGTEAINPKRYLGS